MADQIDSRRQATDDLAGASRPRAAGAPGTGRPPIERAGADGRRWSVRGTNRWSGSPGYLEAPRRTRSASLVEKAVGHIRSLADLLNEPDCQELELVADPIVHRTSAGGRVVHLHQHCRGVPVFEAVRSVRFDSAGGLQDVVGDNVPIAFGLELEPQLAAGEAATLAARHVTASWPGKKRPGKSPARVLATFPLPSRPTVLKKRRLPGEISAHLVLFHRRSELLLGWQVALAERSGASEHNVIVGARDDARGELLYCRCTVDCARARGRVFATNPGDGKRRRLDLPVPLSELPPSQNPDLPADFPPDWVKRKRTRGNNVSSHRGNSKPLKGRKQGGVVDFEASPKTGRDQRVLNAFYLCNYLHDFFYLLGFDEREQNFQKNNFSDAPNDGDELVVRDFGERLEGGSTMRSRRDGKSPEMRLGPLPPFDRPAALDADIVIHEYVHGISHRMVGGGLSFDPLRHPQSEALSEGWSDYFALTIQSWQRPQEPERTVIGAWVADDPGGLRQDPYDDAFPAAFGDLGTEKTVGGSPRQYLEAHDAGEIWCATLMAMNRALGARRQSARAGHELGWRLVIDSLKLMPVGPDAPSFLDARDALLRAADALAVEGQLTAQEHAEVREDLSNVFLRFGMGPAAVSPGAGFDGLIADHG